MANPQQIGGPVHGFRDRQGVRRNANAMLQANLHVIDPAALGGRNELTEPEQMHARMVILQELQRVLLDAVGAGTWTYVALESGALERDVCAATAKAYQESNRRVPGTAIEVTMVRIMFT